MSGRDPFVYRRELVAWHQTGTKKIPKQERYGQTKHRANMSKRERGGPNKPSDALSELRALDWRSIFRTEGVSDARVGLFCIVAL